MVLFLTSPPSLPVNPEILTKLLLTEPINPVTAQKLQVLQVYRTHLLCPCCVHLILFLYLEKKLLTWEDIPRVDNGLIIFVRMSKTTQHGQRIQFIPLAASRTSSTSPCKLLTDRWRCTGAALPTRRCPASLPPSSATSWRPSSKSDWPRWGLILPSSGSTDTLIENCRRQC